MTKRKRAEDVEGVEGVDSVDSVEGADASLATVAANHDDDEEKEEEQEQEEQEEAGGWTVVGPKRRKKEGSHNHKSSRNDAHRPASKSREERRKERKLDRHYPAIEHSHHARLQSHVKMADMQSLALYLLADGTAPQWVSVRSRQSIQKVVMLMVPGLDLGMFNGNVTLDAASPADAISSPTTAPAHVMSDPTAPAHAIASPTAPAHAISGPATPAKDADGDASKRVRISPDDFYPAPLTPSRLPAAVLPLADIFDHVWPIKAPGEHRSGQYIRLHSPIHTMLTSQIPKTHEEKQMKKKGTHKGPVPQNSKHWHNKRTPITEYIATLAEQHENEYVPHPAMFTTPESKDAAMQRRKDAKQSADHGWVDTLVDNLEDGQVPEAEIEQGSVTAGRHVISVDCEMCKAENDQHVLTRLSLLAWDGEVLMDRLVKPDVAIKDYLTQYSGITAAMLEHVTTTLADIQKELLQIVTPRTILVGHSLNSDLNALKLTHPFLVDTGILFPHPRGPPYKQSLKWLAQKYLHREVQKGSKGHDSVEDARTALDLVKQKCEKGPSWGTGDTNAESIFKRIGRTLRPKTNNEYRTGAVIDWGEPNRGHGNQASVSIGCKSDVEVVDAIDTVLKGLAVGKDGTTVKVDFVWARLRELELARGWWDDAKTADVETMRQTAMQRLGLSTDDTDVDAELKGPELGNAVSRTVQQIAQIYESLPRCTALIVYSGTGDPREIRRLQAMQQQYRREYQTKNWDNLSVKWTDTEIQALSKACQEARNGVGFITVR